LVDYIVVYFKNVSHLQFCQARKLNRDDAIDRNS